MWIFLGYLPSKRVSKGCQAKGFPTPKVTWVIVTIPFPVGKTEVKAGWPHYLTITSLHSVDGGFYQCVAKKKKKQHGNKKGHDELDCRTSSSMLVSIFEYRRNVTNISLSNLVWLWLNATLDETRMLYFLFKYNGKEGPACDLSVSWPISSFRIRPLRYYANFII